jgi:predicted membrane protein
VRPQAQKLCVMSLSLLFYTGDKAELMAETARLIDLFAAAIHIRILFGIHFRPARLVLIICYIPLLFHPVIDCFAVIFA